MANQIVSMNKLKQYLKLSLKGYLYRQISLMTGMSRNTINKYKEVLDKHPMSYKELVQLSDKELYSIIYPPSEEKPSHEELYGLFPAMDKQLYRIGVTKFMLWEQYKQNYPDGVQYSQFCEHYRRYQQSQKLSYVFEHKAADKIPISAWHQYINENTIADAILDRIIHQAHLIEMTGESMRKNNKLKSL